MEMKLSNLRVGDVVKTKTDKLYVILPNNNSLNGLGLFSAATCGCESYLSNYNESLVHLKDNSKTIVAVYKASEPHKFHAWSLIRDILSLERDKYSYIVQNFNNWDWAGNEEVTKEMTVGEIEELLGYKIKIVGEE